MKEACKLREVAVHDNIVKLIGVLMETDNYGIILELMVFGNCLSFIQDYTGSILAGSIIICCFGKLSEIY